MTVGMGYIGVKTGLFRAMGGKAEMRAEDIVRKPSWWHDQARHQRDQAQGNVNLQKQMGLESPASLQIFQSTALALRCRIARN